MLYAPVMKATNVTTLPLNRRKTSCVLTAVVKQGQTSSSVDLSGFKELVPSTGIYHTCVLDYVAFVMDFQVVVVLIKC